MLPSTFLAACVFALVHADKNGHVIGAPGFGPNSDNLHYFIVVKGEDFTLNYTGCGNTQNKGCKLSLYETTSPYSEEIEVLEENAYDTSTTFKIDDQPLGRYQFSLEQRDGEKKTTMAPVELRSCESCQLTEAERNASSERALNKPTTTVVSEADSPSSTEAESPSSTNAGSVPAPPAALVIGGLGFILLYLEALF